MIKHCAFNEPERFITRSIGVVGYHVSLTSFDANTEGRRIEPAIDHYFFCFVEPKFPTIYAHVYFLRMHAASGRIALKSH